jgi:hypothetical protein
MKTGSVSQPLHASDDARGAGNLMHSDCCGGQTNPAMPCKGSGGVPLNGKNVPCSACKAGSNGKSPEVYQRGRARVTLTALAHLTVGLNSPALILSSRPDHPWRPPRL